MELSLEQAIQQNQKMISEWMQECKEDNYCAIYMIAIDMTEPNKLESYRFFHSQGMALPEVSRSLKFIAASIDQGKAKKRQNG